MKRKIYSLLLMFIMVVAFVPFSGEVFAEESSYQLEIDTICGLGLMNKTDGDFMPDVKLSRADLAVIISNIYKSGSTIAVEWKEKYFKDLSSELSTPQNLEKSSQSENFLFSDVDNTSEYYESIKLVSELGFMNGYTDGSFGPLNSLTYDQALKVIITMLGYSKKADVYGGFPVGYRRMANELKLLRGINLKNDVITRKYIAILLYNALDVNILEIVSIGKNNSYSSKGTKTFLQAFFGMEKITGRLSDNGFSTLIGNQVSHRDYVVIGGEKIRVTSETGYVRDYLGRTVCAYVENENDDYTMVYAATENTDEIITFDIENFKSFIPGEIKYEVNDSFKTLRFKSNAYMVYNGTGKSVYDENTFKFNKGNVSVIKAKGENFADLIIVNKYDSFYVDYVDYDKKMIFTKTGTELNSISKSYNLDRDDNFYLKIYNISGELTDLRSITSGMVVSIAEGLHSMIIYQSTGRIENFNIETMYKDEQNRLIISNETDSYIISRDYIDKFGEYGIKVGQIYTLLTDKFGDIVYIKEANSDDFLVGKLVQTGLFGDLEKNCQIKIFTSEGTMKIFDCADTVTISDKGNKENKYKSQTDIYNKMNGNNELIRYKLDKNKNITYIELPIEQQVFDNPDNRLQKIRMPKDRDYIEGQGYYYRANHGFGSYMLTDNTAKVFTVDPNLPLSDEDAYGISDGDIFVSDRRYEVFGYTTKKNSCKADFIVYESGAASTFLSLERDRKVAVFDSQYKGLNRDGYASDKIKCYVGTVETDLVLSENCKYILPQWKSTDYNKNNEWKDITLQKGDIFRYLIDGYGEVVEIQLIVDENETNPASGGQGNLAGTIGFWDGADYRYSNPYSAMDSGLNYSFSSSANHAAVGGNTQMRNALYKALSVIDSNQLKVTTQDLSIYDYDPDDSKYLTENIWANNVIFVTIEKNGVSVKSGPASQIKTYEIVGKDCDRVYVWTQILSVRNLIVYTNYSE